MSLEQKKSSQELPKIIQTLFIVDKNRKYLFDVNQDILIKKLKNMISSASGLNKVGLRLFHEGKEYTEYDESSLDELFPNLDLIEFYIQYSYEQIDDIEEIINLKLKQFCNKHNGKYPYFYCFTCRNSICSDCLFSGAHKGHEIKEKYDYLQESKNLVELLFKDLKDILKNTKDNSNDSVEQLKAKVNIQFFPKLVDMVKQIEKKMMNLILFFLEKEKGNYNTIENNVKLLKSHCEEGLDKLKKEIVIEDMMLDENVFLTFDSKFKQIGNEKEKFKDDIEKYKKFSDNLFLIQSIIEKTYKEIYDFLNKYLIVAEFDDIKNKLNSQDISIIDKKIIFDKLLSNIKRKDLNELKVPIEENINDYNNSRKKNFAKNEKMNIDKDDINNGDLIKDNNNIEGKENYIEINTDINNYNNNDEKNKIRAQKKKNLIFESGYLNNNNVNNNLNNNTNYNYTNPFYQGAKNIINEPSKKEKSEINNYDNDNDYDADYIEEKEKDDYNNNKDNNNLNNINTKNYRNNNLNNSRLEPHIMNLRSGNQKINFGQSNNNRLNENRNQYNENKIREEQDYNNTQNIMKTKKEESDEDDLIYEGKIYNIVCNIVPPKNQVVLYDVDKDSIIRKEINFSPLLGLNHFLSECAWVNNNNKLYILGGVDDFSKSTKIFLEFDPIKDKIRRLPDSKYTHSRQSLFAYNDQIFVVGGDRLECEKYDINKNEWSILPNLSFKQIYPVLYVHNDVLYSFFGIDENIRKTDNIQKLNLKNSNKGKWQKVNYKRNKCNLNVFGCGIAKINDNSVLFLGGMDDNGIRDEAIQFDFNNLSAKKTEFLLEEKAYFKDSVLLRLSPNDFGNFSIEESNPFLKIKFQVNVKKMID